MLFGNTPLGIAVKNSQVIDMKPLERMLKADASDINVSNFLGDTPLHLAAQRDLFIWRDLVILLLKYGAELNVSNINGDTPLHLASLQCYDSYSEELIEVLFTHGADVNAVNIYGNTPLHIAAQNQKYAYNKLIEILLQHGADVNAVNAYGETPLHLAAQNENFLSSRMIELLTQYGADANILNVNGDAPIHLVYRQKRTSTFHNVTMFVRKTKNANACNYKNETPLHLAVRNEQYCNVTLIKLLLEYGADIAKKNTMDQNAYQIYCRAMDKRNRRPDSILKLLLQSDITEDHLNSSLHLASLYHNEEAVRKLLNLGVDVNAVSDSGHTPLVYALLAYGDTPETLAKKCSTFNLLLDYGADINHEFSLSDVPLLSYFSKEEGSILDIVLFGIRGMNDQDRFGTWEPYFKHIAKLSMLYAEQAERGLDVPDVLSPRNRHYMNYFPDVRNFVENYKNWLVACSLELKAMKETKVKDEKVTFIDVMFASEKQAMIYAKNKELINGFNAKKFMFPMYEGMLDAKLAKHVERLKLIESAAVVLSDILKFAEPRDVFFEKVLSYCDNEDLIRMTETPDEV